MMLLNLYVTDPEPGAVQHYWRAELRGTCNAVDQKLVDLVVTHTHANDAKEELAREALNQLARLFVE